MFPYIGSCLYKTSSRDIPSHSIIAFLRVYFSLLSSMCKSLILLGGDIKTNPNPVSSSEQYFSICHWNLNSIAAHNYAKLSLLTAYNLVHSFDIICFSETYLKSETPSNDTCLELPSYNLFLSDYLSMIKEKVFVFIVNRPFV